MLDAHRTTIYIIDDCEDMRLLLHDFLTCLGYSTSIFGSAKEALDAIKESRRKHDKRVGADVIVSDLKMPKMNGTDLIRQLKNIGNLTPVILMSAYATPQEMNDALKAGAECCLAKPFELRAMVNAIEKALAPQLLRVVN